MYMTRRVIMSRDFGSVLVWRINWESRVNTRIRQVDSIESIDDPFLPNRGFREKKKCKVESSLSLSLVERTKRDARHKFERLFDKKFMRNEECRCLYDFNVKLSSLSYRQLDRGAYSNLVQRSIVSDIW